MPFQKTGYLGIFVKTDFVDNTAEITSVKLKNRNFSMDVMRGVAVLGILLMNIPGFSIWGEKLEWHDPLLGQLTVDGFIYKTGLLLFEGKMRGLFTLLFGAGIMLFIENKKNDTIEVADAYFRRMLWLLLFGVIDGYFLLWRGDVLYNYALSGMVLFAFRNLRVRYLIIISVLLLATYAGIGGKQFYENKTKYETYNQTTLLLQQGKQLTEGQKKAREEWQEMLGGMLPFSQKAKEERAEEFKKDSVMHHSGYIKIFKEHSKDVSEIESTVFYSEFWEYFGTILLGMALFKLGFFHYRLKIRTYRLWAFIGIPMGIGAFAFFYAIRVRTQAEFMHMYEWRNFPRNFIDVPARIILTLGYASALMLMCKVKWLKGFLSLFSNAGRMALTNYIMQTILCSLYFFGFGLNHYGEYNARGLLLFVIIIWAIQITYCWLYLKYFEMGPLEWLWKRLTYGKKLGLKPKTEPLVE